MRISVFSIMVALLFAAVSTSCTSAPKELPEEIIIGCNMATSSAPSWGPNLIKAAQLAVDQANKLGGINGKKLSLQVVDEGPSASTSLYAVHKLVEERGVSVIIGCTSSDAVSAAGPYVESKGVLLVSPTATSSILSGHSWSKWAYRVSPPDSLQGGVVAKLIKDKGIKKVALLVQDSDYGRGIEESVRSYISGRAEIVASVRYDPLKLSYLTELNTIKDKVPGCVVHAGYYADGAVIYSQAMQLGLDNIPWIAVDGTYDMPLDKYLDAAKFMEKAVIGTVPVPDRKSVIYKDFAEKYRSLYDIEPTIYCDTTYDGLNLIIAAIKKAGVYGGGAIRDALAEIGRNYNGASGKITFDENGERVAGNYGVWKVEMKGTGYAFIMTDQTVSFIKP